jgi:hypothetical protein
MRALSETEACQQHEQWRQCFITAMNCAYSLAETGAHEHVRYELMRANASISAGMVYADLIGIDPTGWLDRMHEVERLWVKVQA